MNFLDVWLDFLAHNKASACIRPGMEMREDVNKHDLLTSRVFHFMEAFSIALKCHNYHSQQLYM